MAFYREAEAAGHKLGVSVSSAGVHDGAEIEQAIIQSAHEAGTGLIVLPHVVTSGYRELITELALRHRLPVVSVFRFMATSGALLSYGIDVVELHRQAAGYVDRILRGTKPPELPVQAPTKFELVINLRRQRRSA